MNDATICGVDIACPHCLHMHKDEIVSARNMEWNGAPPKWLRTCDSCGEDFFVCAEYLIAVLALMPDGERCGTERPGRP